MSLLDRINRTGTTVVMATHDAAIVDNMRRRVIEVDHGSVIRDQARGIYGLDPATSSTAGSLPSPSARAGASEMASEGATEPITSRQEAVRARRGRR